MLSWRATLSVKTPRGMTLTEVLVYITLLSLFTILIFVNLPRTTNQSLEDIQEATVVAQASLTRMSLELGNSSASSVSTPPEQDSLVFLGLSADGRQPAGYTESGKLAWAGWVAYSQLRGFTPTLVRSWKALPRPLAREDILDLLTVADVTREETHPTILARNVKSFSVLATDGGVWQMKLTLEVHGSTVTISSSAKPRN